MLFLPPLYFLADVDEQLMMVANINSCPERDRYVIWDEMYIKSDLVYDKHSGEYITCVHCMYMCNIHVYTSCSYFFLIKHWSSLVVTRQLRQLNLCQCLIRCLIALMCRPFQLESYPEIVSKLHISHLFEGELCMCVHVHTVHVCRLYMTSTSMCMYTSVF